SGLDANAGGPGHQAAQTNGIRHGLRIEPIQRDGVVFARRNTRKLESFSGSGPNRVAHAGEAMRKQQNRSGIGVFNVSANRSGRLKDDLDRWRSGGQFHAMPEYVAGAEQYGIG